MTNDVIGRRTEPYVAESTYPQAKTGYSVIQSSADPAMHEQVASIRGSGVSETVLRFPRMRDERMTSGEVLPGPGDGHAPVILLVEDDVLVRFTTAETLRDSGYHVLEAVDAGEALSLIGTGHPLDLVLSDVRMPGQMDGVALTYAIKEVRPNLPVVLVSSHLEPNTSHAGEAFLSKPYQVGELFKIVERFVGVEWQTKYSSPTAS